MIEVTRPVDPSSAGLWRELEAKLRPFVTRRVRESDVDDVLQEVFLRIQRGLPSLRDDDRFGAWVYRVTRSAIIDHGRIAARHPQSPHDRIEPSEHFDARDENDADENDAGQEVALYAAFFVSILPSPYREALTLTELQGLTQKMAAERPAISLSGMKSRVQRGRAMLRAALEDCCHIALDARRRVIACEPRSDGKLPQGCCE